MKYFPHDNAINLNTLLFSYHKCIIFLWDKEVGQDQPKETPQIIRYVIAVGIAIGIILFVFNYDRLITYPLKQALLEAGLKDPQSVQYMNRRMTANAWFCGEMNSKNAYGAYTGFKRFAVGGPGDVWIDDYGNVGKGENDNEATFIRSMRTLDEEIARLKRKNAILVYRRVNGNEPPFSELTELEYSREVFQAKWKKVCSQ